MNHVQLQEPTRAGEPGGMHLRPRWSLAVALAAIALTRTVFRVVEHAVHAQVDDRISLTITLTVSFAWIAVLALRRGTPAIPTLVAAGVIQAVAGVTVTFVASWIIGGPPGGSAGQPVAALMTLGGGALWGLVCGAVATALQNARQGIPGTVGRPTERLK